MLYSQQQNAPCSVLCPSRSSGDTAIGGTEYPGNNAYLVLCFIIVVCFNALLVTSLAYSNSLVAFWAARPVRPVSPRFTPLISFIRHWVQHYRNSPTTSSFVNSRCRAFAMGKTTKTCVFHRNSSPRSFSPSVGALRTTQY